MERVIQAVLADVGGTLWPDAWPERADDLDVQAHRLLGATRAHIEPDQLATLVRRLGRLSPPADGGRQDTDAEVSLVLDEIGMTQAFSDPATVRRAMCLPAEGRVRPFPGAAGALTALADAGLVVTLVSNTLWRDGSAYLDDFDALGLGPIAGAVSSVDVGFRKPHPAMFEAALAMAECPPKRCAVVGDSKDNDIVPGRAMGAYTVLVAIENPPPENVPADAAVTNLAELPDVLLGGRRP